MMDYEPEKPFAVERAKDLLNLLDLKSSNLNAKYLCLIAERYFGAGGGAEDGHGKTTR
ncbi:MAG: hypothetical protein R6U32_01230 [Candidatus Woesearchaeota archaeon]